MCLPRSPLQLSLRFLARFTSCEDCLELKYSYSSFPMLSARLPIRRFPVGERFLNHWTHLFLSGYNIASHPEIVKRFCFIFIKLAFCTNIFLCRKNNFLFQSFCGLVYLLSVKMRGPGFARAAHFHLFRSAPFEVSAPPGGGAAASRSESPVSGRRADRQ